MKINKPQAEVLLKYMIEAAKAVAEDFEWRHSDYAGDEKRKFMEKVDELLHEINELSE